MGGLFVMMNGYLAYHCHAESSVAYPLKPPPFPLRPPQKKAKTHTFNPLPPPLYL